jgi:hypothetical protein
LTVSVTLRGVTYTPPPEPVFRLDDMTTPRRRRKGGLIGAGVAGVLTLMAGTGLAVWFIASPSSTTNATTPPAAATAAGAREAIGTVVLQHSQFKWNGLADTTCQGRQGFADIAGGAQVTVTDASGKVLAIGALWRGTASGITSSDVNGLPQAETCTLPFSVPGIASGAGPYGVEIAHRGIVRFDEGNLDTIRIGF